MRTVLPTLGIDLDNVLARSDEVIRRLLEEQSGLRLEQGDIREFDYARCGATRQQSDDALTAFHEGRCLDARVLEHAVEALTCLRAHFRIEIVTSRPQSARGLTARWLSEKGLGFDALMFEVNKVENGSRFAAFVEDNGTTAVALANLGVPTVLFDYPWNALVSHRAVHRVSSWDEAVAVLRRLKT